MSLMATAPLTKTELGATPNFDLDSISISTLGTSSSSGVPSGYLTLYSALVKFVVDYKKAFDEENANRMAAYLVEVSKKVSEYASRFSKDTKADIDEVLEKKKANLEKAVEKALAEKKNKSEDKSFVEKIETRLEYLKNEVLDLIFKAEKGDVLGKKVEAEREKKKGIVKINKVSLLKSLSTASKKLFGTSEKIIVENFVKTTKLADSVSSTTLLESASLRTKISNSFKDISESFKKSAFSGISEVLKTVVKTTWKSTLWMVRRAVNFVEFTIKTALALKSILKIVGFAAKLVLAPIRVIFSIASKTIGIAWRGVKFLANAVYSIGKGVLSLASSILSTGLNLAKKVLETISKISVLGIVKKALRAFFSTYVGAYVLGYFVGTIWKCILKLAGLSNEEIASGDYTMLGILSNLYEKIRDKISGVYSKLVEKFGKNKEDFVEQVKESEFGKKVSSLVDYVSKPDEEGKTPWRRIMDVLGKFYEYGSGLVFFAQKIIGFLIGNNDLSFRNFSLTNIGVSRWLGGFRWLSKLPALKGGIAGLIAFALSGGFGSALTLFKNESGKAEEGKPWLNVTKKSASLFGYKSGDQEEKDRFSFPTTTLAMKEATLMPLYKKSRTEKDPEKRKALLAKEERARDIYSAFVKEKDNLDNLKSGFLLLAENYEKLNGGDGYDFRKVKLIEDILTVNGKPIVPLEDYFRMFGDKKFDRRAQTFLNAILKARIDYFQESFANFQRSLEDEADTLELFDPFSKRLNIVRTDVLYKEDKKDKYGLPKDLDFNISLTVGDYYNGSFLNRKATMLDQINAILEIEEAKSSFSNAFSSHGSKGGNFSGVSEGIAIQKSARKKIEEAKEKLGQRNLSIEFDDGTGESKARWRHSSIYGIDDFSNFIAEIDKIVENFQKAFLTNLGTEFSKDSKVFETFSDILNKDRQAGIDRLQNDTNRLSSLMKDDSTSVLSIAKDVFNETLQNSINLLKQRRNEVGSEADSFIDSLQNDESAKRAREKAIRDVEEASKGDEQRRNGILEAFRKLIRENRGESNG